MAFVRRCQPTSDSAPPSSSFFLLEKGRTHATCITSRVPMPCGGQVQLLRMEGSTGRQRVPKTSSTVACLSLSRDREQTAIARVLDAVDAAIRRTREANERAQASQSWSLIAGSLRRHDCPEAERWVSSRPTWGYEGRRPPATGGGSTAVLRIPQRRWRCVVTR